MEGENVAPAVRQGKVPAQGASKRRCEANSTINNAECNDPQSPDFTLGLRYRALGDIGNINAPTAGGKNAEKEKVG